MEQTYYTTRTISDLLDTIENTKAKRQKHDGVTCGIYYDRIIENLINTVDAETYKIFGTSPNCGTAGELIIKAMFNKPLKINNDGKDLVLNRKPYEIKTVIYDSASELKRIPAHLIIYDGQNGYLIEGEEVKENFALEEKISRKKLRSLERLENYRQAFERLLEEYKKGE